MEFSLDYKTIEVSPFYSSEEEENYNLNESNDINDERFYYIEKDKSQIDNNSFNEGQEEFNNNIYPQNILNENNIYNFPFPYNMKNPSVNLNASIGNIRTSVNSKLLTKKTKRINDDKSKNMGRKTKDGKKEEVNLMVSDDIVDEKFEEEIVKEKEKEEEKKEEENKLMVL